MNSLQPGWVNTYNMSKSNFAMNTITHGSNSCSKIYNVHKNILHENPLNIVYHSFNIVHRSACDTVRYNLFIDTNSYTTDTLHDERRASTLSMFKNTALCFPICNFPLFVSLIFCFPISDGFFSFLRRSCAPLKCSTKRSPNLHSDFLRKVCTTPESIVFFLLTNWNGKCSFGNVVKWNFNRWNLTYLHRKPQPCFRYFLFVFIFSSFQYSCSLTLCLSLFYSCSPHFSSFSTTFWFKTIKITKAKKKLTLQIVFSPYRAAVPAFSLSSSKISHCSCNDWWQARVQSSICTQ